MSLLTLRPGDNKNVSLIHVVNFLVSYTIMTLADAADLYTKFKAGQDVVLEIPEQLLSTFKETLDSRGFRYE